MYKSFEDMPVWQKAFDLANKIYDLTEKFPKTEAYSLCEQLKRSAVSISANIAESFGRQHSADKINFYYFARGSLLET
ncbi:MAG: four helix bundle protein [Clostridia bacterium]|nr:four helix bundle protein [Clostridia bacterium]